MSAPERHKQFSRAAAAPLSFVPAHRIAGTRWVTAKRFALIASATLGVWALLLAPGGRLLA